MRADRSVAAAGTGSILFAMEGTVARLLTAGLLAIGGTVVLSIRTCTDCAEGATGDESPQ